MQFAISTLSNLNHEFLLNCQVFSKKYLSQMVSRPLRIAKLMYITGVQNDQIWSRRIAGIIADGNR